MVMSGLVPLVCVLGVVLFGDAIGTSDSGAATPPGAAARPPAPAGNGPAAEAWQSLFNGRDLEGWTMKIAGHDLGEDPYETARVEGGVLRMDYSKYDRFSDRFGHLFHRTPHTHYRLRVEYRFVGTQCAEGPGWALRNSGVMIHCQSPQSMRRDQSFPVSIEVQYLGGDGTNPRPTANLCTPGTLVHYEGKLDSRHCIDADAPTFHGDQWVTVEVEVHGAEIARHLVGDKVVLEYEHLQLDPADADAKRLMTGDDAALAGGWIALQAESHPIEFRRVELLPLPGDRAEFPVKGAP